MDGMTDPTISRRGLLRASGGTFGLSLLDDRPRWFADDCPEATVEPSMGHHEDGGMACDDDHSETESLRSAVDETITTQYPDIGRLLDEGFVPYFDIKIPPSRDGYSHWIQPEYLADEAVLDPDRPESILVDNERWQPIGVMFIATKGGEPVEDPPAVYTEGEDDVCAPWHYHTGLPGRFAWWYYRKAFEGEFRTDDRSFPCATPKMLHLWTVPHPEGAYAHGPPPQEYRDSPPADDPGFETSVEPHEEPLSWDVLPDDVESRAKPNEWLAKYWQW